MWQSEAVGLNYQITLLSNVPCGQPVIGFRPEADSDYVHDAPECPWSFPKEKRDEERGKKRVVFTFNMHVHQL